MSTISATRLRSAAATIGALALAATLAGSGPATAGPPTSCRVKNLDTGVTTWTLQKAVDRASRGDRLTVRGTCHGVTVIGKNLRISGIRTATSGKPILDADDQGSVVTVKRDVTVAMKRLTVRDGRTGLGGGGIDNEGTLTLRDVVVRGNEELAMSGGGIHDRGTVRLYGSSSIRANPVDGNGGGVANDGTSVMNDSSSIRRNGALHGVGVENDGILVMRGSSSIHHNTSLSDGGGIKNHAGDPLDGVVCGLGGNVHDNQPVDC